MYDMNDRFDVKDFLQAPGDKCPRCWLMSRHCCCAGLPESAPRSSIEAFFAWHFDETPGKILPFDASKSWLGHAR